MNDQASLLRELMEQRRRSPTATGSGSPSACAQSLAFLSGKGGVGKTNIALNSAIALQQTGRRVCVWDFSGAASVDLLCGTSGDWDFQHVLSGARRLDDVLIAGPEGVKILTGLGCLAEWRRSSAASRAIVGKHLGALEREYDDLVLDLPTGFSELASRTALAATRAVLLTTPEPTSIADAYATIKSLVRLGRPNLALLVNRVHSAEQAFDIIDRVQQTSRMFLQFDVGVAGYVPEDPQLARAVLRRRPVVLESPHAPSAEALCGLARRLPCGQSPPTSLVERLFGGFAGAVE